MGLAPGRGIMKCINSKLFLASLVVLLLSLSAISAEVCLTDAEADELDQILLELKTRSTQQLTQLQTLGGSLKLSRSELKRTQELLLTSGQALERAQSSYNADKAYWWQRERELKTTTILASIAAAAVGFLAGWIASR